MSSLEFASPRWTLPATTSFGPFLVLRREEEAEPIRAVLELFSRLPAGLVACCSRIFLFASTGGNRFVGRSRLGHLVHAEEQGGWDVQYPSAAVIEGTLLSFSRTLPTLVETIRAVLELFSRLPAGLVACCSRIFLFASTGGNRFVGRSRLGHLVHAEEQGGWDSIILLGSTTKKCYSNVVWSRLFGSYSLGL